MKSRPAWGDCMVGEPALSLSVTVEPEAAAGLGPGQPDDARAVPVRGAVAARRRGVQDGTEPAGVETPSAAFLLMVVECAGGPAFRAGPARLRVMREVDVDLAGGGQETVISKVSRR